MECCQNKFDQFSLLFSFQVQYEKKLIIGGIEQFQEQQNEENIYFAYLRFDYGISMLIDLYDGNNQCKNFQKLNVKRGYPKLTFLR